MESNVLKARAGGNVWPHLVACLLLGCAAGWAVRSGLSAPSPWAAILKLYQAVGVTLIALGPMAVVTLAMILRQLLLPNTVSRKMVFDYHYISETAPTLGLLGTVIALVMAGIALGREVQTGSADAVLRIIPEVGRALISTVLGLIIKWFADSALHFTHRGRLDHDSVQD